MKMNWKTPEHQSDSCSVCAAEVLRRETSKDSSQHILGTELTKECSLVAFLVTETGSVT
jgi:hypothetical protein